MNDTVRMLFPAPSTSEDRARELRDGASPWRRHGLITSSECEAIGQRGVDRYRHYGAAVSVVFFGLTALGVAALFGLCDLLHLPKGAITAILSIGAAELLIRKARFFGTGIESALWLGGLFAIIFDLPSSGRPEALLVFAAAFALAGLRMRNALMEAVAVVLIVVYAAVKSHSQWPPMLAGMLIAIAAAIALQRVWQRSSSEHFFAALAVVMPVAGYVTRFFAGSWGHRTVALDSSLQITAMLLLTALVFFTLGIRSRDRLLLISGALVIALAIFENRHWFPWSIETQCIVGGVMLTAIGMAISRSLHGGTEGFVVTPVEAGSYEELAQIGGALLVAHPASDAPALPQAGGGGGFGGGGASGDY